MEEFQCKICDKSFSTRQGLGNHIGRYHNKKEYYDKFMKSENEGICIICEFPTIFRNMTLGYKQTCENKKCIAENIKNKSEKAIQAKYGVKSFSLIPGVQDKKRKTCLKKYGVEVSSQSNIVKNKNKQTCLKNHGVENVYQSEKIKEKCRKTKKEKYGNENFTNRKKAKQTCLKNHGVEWSLMDPSVKELGNQKMKELYGENPLTHPDIKKKKEETSLKKYGVKSPNQSDIVKKHKEESYIRNFGVSNPMKKEYIFDKQQYRSGYRQKFNEKLHYQGSYELDFLRKYSEILNIENGKTFKYNDNRIYYSDFYISSLNLIIEIKGSYYYNRDIEVINLKKESVLKEGYNYIMILDKDYTEFEKLIR
jgi:hypothetical protein